MSDANKDDLRADWVDHPYAGVVRKRMEDQLQIAKNSLHSACSQSSDAKVRGAYDKMKAIEQTIDVLAKGVT